MKRDIRLYYYEAGQLYKYTNKKGMYLFDSPGDAISFIDKINEKSHLKGRQWVVTEYFEIYKSKILTVIQK